MKTFTRAELEKLPKCLYQPFIPCTCENLPRGEELSTVMLRKRKCLSCSLVGIQDGLVTENLAGAMMCFDSVLLVLKDIGIVLNL